jgi:hypothetical protein
VNAHPAGFYSIGRRPRRYHNNIHALVHDQFMTIDKLAHSTPLQPSAGSCCVDRPMEATTIESTFLRRVCSRTINLLSLFGFTYSRSSHQPARILEVDKISPLRKLRSVEVARAPCIWRSIILLGDLKFLWVPGWRWLPDIISLHTHAFCPTTSPRSLPDNRNFASPRSDYSPRKKVVNLNPPPQQSTSCVVRTL